MIATCELKRPSFSTIRTVFASVIIPLIALSCISCDEQEKEIEESIQTSDVVTGEIVGTVVLAGYEDHQGVQIILQDTDFTTSSNEAGRFTLAGVSPGTYTVIAEKEGFESATQQVEATAGASVNVEFPLLRITEGYYQQKVNEVTATFEGITQAWRENDWKSYEPFWSHKDDVVFIVWAGMGGQRLEGWDNVKPMLQQMLSFMAPWHKEINLLETVIRGEKASVRFERTDTIGTHSIFIYYLRLEAGQWRVYLFDMNATTQMFEKA